MTVLFSRTQPLIRYEMSDTITLSDVRCAAACRSRYFDESMAAPRTS